MKQLLNTLFVTTQGAYLARRGQTVLVRVAKETKLRVPVHTLESIVCFGRVGCSPALMELCGSGGVLISFLTPNGRFRARVQGPTSGNVLLRRTQYRAADDDGRSAQIAQAIVAGKIANCRTVLLRAAREQDGSSHVPALRSAAAELAQVMQGLSPALALDVVRGHEGEAAKTYFAFFDHLITAQKPEFAFTKRSRRPPLDRINALLSFLYAMLTNDVVAALESVGLDPAVGFLHRDRPGRSGLALDLVEELRPVLADRLALTVVNRRQVKAGGFQITESGAVNMSDDTRKEVLTAYQNRKRDEIVHPFLNERVPLGLLPYVQALLMARHLRGDLDGYPPFLWK